MLNWHPIGIEIECVHTMPTTWQVNTQDGALRYHHYQAIPSQYLRYAFCYVPVVGEFMQHQPQAYAALNAAAADFTSLQLKHDPTIELPSEMLRGSYQPLEIISPILKNQTSTAAFIDLLHLFEKAGAEQNASTATQFHIDVQSIDLLSLSDSLNLLGSLNGSDILNLNMQQDVLTNNHKTLDANFKNKKINALDAKNDQATFTAYLLEHIFQAKFIQFFLILNFQQRNIFSRNCKDLENIPQWAKIIPNLENIEIKNRALKNKKTAQANCYKFQEKIQAQQINLEHKEQKRVLNYIHHLLDLNYLPNLIAYNSAHELDIDLFFKSLAKKGRNLNEEVGSELCQYTAKARFRSVNLESFYKHGSLEVRHLSPALRYQQTINLPSEYIEKMTFFLQLLIIMCKKLAAYTLCKFIENGFFENIQATIAYILRQAENPEYGNLTIKNLFEKPKEHHTWLPKHRENIHRLLSFSDKHQNNTAQIWQDLQNDELWMMIHQELQLAAAEF